MLGNDLIQRPLSLRIEDGVISTIASPDAAVPAREDSAPVIDHGTAPIVPGWVNAHVHLAMAPLRGVTTRTARRGNVVEDIFFRVESGLTRADVLAFTRLAAMESLLLGVTEVWDHYYFADAAAEALGEVGLTATVAPTLQDLSGPGARSWEEALEVTEKMAEDAHLRQRGIRAAVGLHASDTASPNLVLAAGALARKQKLPVHMHFLQHAEEVARSAQTYPEGITSGLLSRLGEVDLLIAHALFASNADIEQLTYARAQLAFCPLSQSQFGFLSPIAEWMQHGGRFVLGTDTVASNDSLDLQRELCQLAGLPGLAASFSREREALLLAGSPGAQALAAAAQERRRKIETQAPYPIEPETLLPAAFGLHLPGGPRGIQVGAPANLLVLEPSHPALFPSEALPRALCSASLGDAVRQVYSRGRPIFPEEGRKSSYLETVAYQNALAEAVARRDELWARTLGPS